jgi:hypothetical protein
MIHDDGLTTCDGCLMTYDERLGSLDAPNGT